MIIQLNKQTPNPWYRLSDDERRAAWMADARRRGGITRSQQESMSLARSKGYWRLWETKPTALLWLKKRIRSWNQAHADAHNLHYEEWRWQRFKTLRLIYKKYENRDHHEQ
jgi:hypothetical protein